VKLHGLGLRSPARDGRSSCHAQVCASTAVDGFTAEHAVDEAIARIKQILAE
jgi:hypothetical protein